MQIRFTAILSLHHFTSVRSQKNRWPGLRFAVQWQRQGFYFSALVAQLDVLGVGIHPYSMSATQKPRPLQELRGIAGITGMAGATHNSFQFCRWTTLQRRTLKTFCHPVLPGRKPMQKVEKKWKVVFWYSRWQNVSYARAMQASVWQWGVLRQQQRQPHSLRVQTPFNQGRLIWQLQVPAWTVLQPEQYLASASKKISLEHCADVHGTMEQFCLIGIEIHIPLPDASDDGSLAVLPTIQSPQAQGYPA